MLKKIVFLLVAFLPIIAFAQSEVSIKMLNLESKKGVVLGEYERGKVWIEKGEKRIFLYNGDSVKAFSLKDETLLPVGEALFDEGDFRINDWKEGEHEKKEKIKTSPFVPAFLGYLDLKNINPTFITTDKKGELLFVADGEGFIYVFNVSKRDYLGRLKFLKQPIKYIKALKNEGLLIIYEGGVVSYIERFKIPFFSFLQDLKSSYVLKNQATLPVKFVSSFAVNESEDKMILAGDHKVIIGVALPSLTYDLVDEDKLYIEFADFIGDKTVIYITLKEKSIKDSEINVHPFHHFSVMAAFFDMRRFSISSPSGRFFSRIKQDEEIEVIDFAVPAEIGRINFDIKKFGNFFFCDDDRTFIILDKKQKDLYLYRIIERKH